MMEMAVSSDQERKALWLEHRQADVRVGVGAAPWRPALGGQEGRKETRGWGWAGVGAAAWRWGAQEGRRETR